MTLLFSSSVSVGHLMIIHRQMGCSGGFWRTQNKFSHVCHLRRMIGRLGSYGTQGQREGMDAPTYWLQNGQISHMVITDSKGEICNNQGGNCVVLTTKLLKPESTFSVVYWPTVTAYPYLRGGNTEPTSAWKLILKFTVMV